MELIQDLPAEIVAGRPIDPPIKVRCSTDYSPKALHVQLKVATVDGLDSHLDLLEGVCKATPYMFSGKTCYFKFCSQGAGWPRFRPTAVGHKVGLSVALVKGEDQITSCFTIETVVKETRFDFQQEWVQDNQEQRWREEEREPLYILACRAHHNV